MNQLMTKVFVKQPLTLPRSAKYQNLQLRTKNMQVFYIITFLHAKLSTYMTMKFTLEFFCGSLNQKQTKNIYKNAANGQQSTLSHL